MSKEQGYEAAYAELQEILVQMEEGEISIDQLSDKVKRASILLQQCKEKLRTTQSQVDDILNSLQQEQ